MFDHTQETLAIAVKGMLVLINWLTMLVSMVATLHYNLCLKAKSKLCFGVKIDMLLAIFGQRFVDYLQSAIWRYGRLSPIRAELPR
jgi:hypothetical protein